jgi:N-acyl-D-aspartate/D-glutamate deacylase
MLKLSTALCFIAVMILISSDLIRAEETEYDIILKNGMIYDGSGKEPFKGDVAIKGDKIVGVGKLENAKGKQEIDVKGLAVAPGFVNMLSWATDSLIEDGTSLSDIRQGVTLEVFGEGFSYGPLNDSMKKEMEEMQGDIKYKVEWTTLGQYLEFLEKKGISPNVASFVGATTVRVHVVGYEDRAPNAEELEKMRSLVKQAMEEGAMGVGSSLIYAPAFYAKTDELIELCKVASPYGGMYISHMRSEANKLLEAVDELIRISREAKLPAEIYHLKAAGVQNWKKMDDVIRKVEAAQKEGLKITADMYMYPAGATGLDAAMPPWVQEGGFKKWRERLMDPKIRERVIKEMSTPSDDWENLYLLAGSADHILLVDFKNEKLKPLTGKTLADVAKMRGKSPQETAMDLVVEDESRVGTVYFLMSEDNIKKEVALPWVSFGSDEGSYRPEGVFLKSNAHPRAYGNFARVLGKYVREEKALTLQDAVRRLSSLPSENMKIKDRGALKPGYYADIVVFDPAHVADHATFDKPHQLATGVLDVFVNGTQVLKDQEHTGAKPGRVVRGPGWKQGSAASAVQ